MALVEAHFVDPDGSGFLDTADDREPLLARPRGLQDNAVPSGNAMAATVFLSLAALSGEQRYAELARSAVSAAGRRRARYPTAFAQWLHAVGHRAWRSTRSRSWGSGRGGRRRARRRLSRDASVRGACSRVSRDPDRSMRAAASRSGTHGRPCRRLRLPRVRLPAAGHRPGRARRGSSRRPAEPRYACGTRTRSGAGSPGAAVRA